MDAIEQTSSISKIQAEAGVAESKVPLNKRLVSSIDFQNIVESVADTESPTRKLSTKEEEAISEYTSIITTQFIGAILDEQSSIFDSGDGASEHYHTMMVEAVSDQLTRTDALGLKSIIQWEISRW